MTGSKTMMLLSGMMCMTMSSSSQSIPKDYPSRPIEGEMMSLKALKDSLRVSRPFHMKLIYVG